jgi:hypothetical protein
VVVPRKRGKRGKKFYLFIYLFFFQKYRGNTMDKVAAEVSTLAAASCFLRSWCLTREVASVCGFGAGMVRLALSGVEQTRP